MTMDRKSIIGLVVKALVLIGFVAATYPFLASMQPSAKAVNDALVLIELPILEPGVVNEVDVKGAKLFVLKPNQAQKEAITELDPHFPDASYSSYQEDIGAYVYWAYSTKFGCPLEHKPPQDSRIRRWVDEAKWLGGYWDYMCEVSYDYAGRAISRYEYTYNGYSWPHDSLYRPKVFEKSGDKYVISRNYVHKP